MFGSAISVIHVKNLTELQKADRISNIPQIRLLIKP